MPYTREDRYNFAFIDLTTSTTVASGGGVEYMDLKPDIGFTYEVIFFKVQIPDPSGSGSGTHRLSGGYWDGSAFRGMFYIQSNTGTAIETAESGFVGTAEQPATPTDQFQIISKQLISASNSNPFRFRYINSTDVNQTGDKLVQVWVKKFREAI